MAMAVSPYIHPQHSFFNGNFVLRPVSCFPSAGPPGTAIDIKFDVLRYEHVPAGFPRVSSYLIYVGKESVMGHVISTSAFDESGWAIMHLRVTTYGSAFDMQMAPSFFSSSSSAAAATMGTCQSIMTPVLPVMIQALDCSDNVCFWIRVGSFQHIRQPLIDPTSIGQPEFFPLFDNPKPKLPPLSIIPHQDWNTYKQSAPPTPPNSSGLPSLSGSEMYMKAGVVAGADVASVFATSNLASSVKVPYASILDHVSSADRSTIDIGNDITDNSKNSVKFLEPVKVCIFPPLDVLGHTWFDEETKNGRRWICMKIGLMDFSRINTDIDEGFSEQPSSAQEIWKSLFANNPATTIQLLVSFLPVPREIVFKDFNNSYMALSEDNHIPASDLVRLLSDVCGYVQSMVNDCAPKEVLDEYNLEQFDAFRNVLNNTGFADIIDEILVQNIVASVVKDLDKIHNDTHGGVGRRTSSYNNSFSVQQQQNDENEGESTNMSNPRKRTRRATMSMTSTKSKCSLSQRRRPSRSCKSNTNTGSSSHTYHADVPFSIVPSIIRMLWSRIISI